MWKKEPFYRLLVLSAWFVFLLVMLFGGRYQTYIRKGYGVLLAGGLVILLALICTGARNVRDRSAHHLKYTTSLVFLILVFPILLTIAVRPGSLSTFAAASRGISTSLAGSDENLMDALQSQIESEGAFKKLNIKQIITIADREPDKIEGMQVSAEGFVYNQPAQPSGSFMLVRFLITCCAADATPLGVEVRSEETLQLPKDTWVRVQGTVKVENGKPVITQSGVTQVPKPSNAYLY